METELFMSVNCSIYFTNTPATNKELAYNIRQLEMVES